MPTESPLLRRPARCRRKWTRRHPRAGPARRSRGRSQGRCRRCHQSPATSAIPGLPASSRAASQAAPSAHLGSGDQFSWLVPHLPPPDPDICLIDTHRSRSHAAQHGSPRRCTPSAIHRRFDLRRSRLSLRLLRFHIQGYCVFRAIVRGQQLRLNQSALAAGKSLDVHETTCLE
jgi:hypothetical protein